VWNLIAMMIWFVRGFYTPREREGDRLFDALNIETDAVSPSGSHRACAKLAGRASSGLLAGARRLNAPLVANPQLNLLRAVQ
jgi:hypothetical protein